MKITLVGMGSGAPGSLTAAGLEALRGAERIIGARRLVEALSSDAQVDVRVIPGISSASYLAARLARPWQDLSLIHI